MFNVNSPLKHLDITCKNNIAFIRLQQNKHVIIKTISRQFFNNFKYESLLEAIYFQKDENHMAVKQENLKVELCENIFKKPT